jgi:GH15 family glucan-1,4-alpha-glucosidase
VTTLWLSQYYSRINKNEEAKKLIDWSLDKALSSGILSEQIDPETSQIKSVTPLVWSHAELINAILDLG